MAPDREGRETSPPCGARNVKVTPQIMAPRLSPENCRTPGGPRGQSRKQGHPDHLLACCLSPLTHTPRQARETRIPLPQEGSRKLEPSPCKAVMIPFCAGAGPKQTLNPPSRRGPAPRQEGRQGGGRKGEEEWERRGKDGGREGGGGICALPSMTISSQPFAQSHGPFFFKPEYQNSFPWVCGSSFLKAHVPPPTLIQ